MPSKAKAILIGILTGIAAIAIAFWKGSQSGANKIKVKVQEHTIKVKEKTAKLLRKSREDNEREKADSTPFSRKPRFMHDDSE